MKNEKQVHPLKKNTKDLTPDDIKALEKPLGTSDRPFPMWGTQRVEHNGRGDLEQVLSVIADDTYPMKVYSERPYREVVAMAYCDMPVPSMLPLFKDGLERRAPDSINRSQMMIGNPGHGKSFLGALQGRLRQNDRVEIYDCGGKNMNDLLFEMVLDFGAGDALPRAIDKRLQAGTLEPLSMGLLKGLPSEVVTLDDKGHVQSIDWNGLKSAGTDKVEAAFEVLKKVSKTEGLDNAGGNALGMNSQYGALVRAFMEKREIVLDEYNKSREGSDNALQTVWQFVIGELKEVTVENPLKNKDSTSGPSSFTFRREDMGSGFFVTLTGNKTEDGVTTRSLNKSVYSRLSPQTLPDPDVIDWQHRICQMMVGLPVSTLYVTFKDQADKDPDQFGQWLLWLRRTKAEVEGTTVPELQETLLSNWKNVVNSSEKLARFYDKWAKLTDAEKITSNSPDLVEEVDEEYSKKEGIDFRKIKQHLEEAIPIKPRMQKEDAPRALNMGSWEKAPKLGEPVVENPSLNFGTRLTEFLERMVYEKTGAVGKHKLYEKLTKSMQEFALRDITLQEAARSKQRSVEEDLNISAFTDRDMGKQAAMARKVFCEYLRQENPEFKQASDDDIATPKVFRAALEAVAANKDAAAKNELFVANRDPETLAGGKPLTSAVIKDIAVYVAQKKEGIDDFGMSDLVHHDDFLASLALPTVGAKNLSSVWDQNIRPLTRSTPANDVASPSGVSASGAGALDQDEGLYIAEGRSDKKIGTTTLQVLWSDEQGERPVSVHIVRNEARGKTLVVSEKAPSKLLAAFKEAGVTHVDRHDPGAQVKVEAALADITRGMPASVKDRLVDAFKYRNDVSEETTPHLKGKNPQLAELLVDDKIDMMYPKYLIKNDKKRANGPK